MSRRALLWSIGAAVALATAGFLVLRGDGQNPVETTTGPHITVQGPISADASESEPGPARPDAVGPAPVRVSAPPVAAGEPRVGNHIAGRVVDGKGIPLGGVRVRAAPTDPSGGHGESEVAEAFTAGDGAFRLDGLGQGPVILVAKAGGRRAAVVRDVQPGTDPLEVVLPTRTGVEGRVLDGGTGEPVLRFVVKTTQASIHYERRREERSSRTFETRDGTFAITDLEAGRFEFLVEAEGFVPAKIGPLFVQDSEVRRDLEARLVPALEVRGKVVAADSGEPVALALLSHHDPESPARRGKYVHTGEDGAFLVKGISPGTRLEVTHREFVPATTEPLGMTGAPAADVVIRLTRGGGVDGYALAEDGSPCSDVWVYATQKSRYPAPSVHKDVDSDASGYFRIQGLVAGTYEVGFIPPGPRGESWSARARRPRVKRVAEVEEGKVTRVKLEAMATGGCTVRGRVLLGDEGVSKATVELLPSSAVDPATGRYMIRPFHDWTDDGCEYEFRGVPPGEATLTVETHGVGVSEYGRWRIEIPAEKEFLFDARLSGGEIRGRVVKASDGSPVVGGSVSVSRRNAPSERLTLGGWIATDSEGRYRARGLQPGAYRVSVVPGSITIVPGDAALEGLASQWRERVEVASDETVTVDFVLEPGPSALVLVTDPTGAPMSGEQVHLLTSGKDGGPWKEAFTDAKGVARARGLAPGRYIAYLPLRPEYWSQPSEPRVVRPGEETEFRLDLKKPVRVPVRLRGDGDLPIGMGWVRFVKPGSEGNWVPWIESDERGEAAAYLLRGEYAVEAEAPGHPRRSRSIRIGDATPPEILVRLERQNG